jgi:hypothetical protein
MKRFAITGSVAAGVLGLLASVGCQARAQEREAANVTTPLIAAAAPLEVQADALYGRITTDAGETYEGRLRWGGAEEAFWGDYFNGTKRANPWVAYVPPNRLTGQRAAIEIFGWQIGRRDQQIDLTRPFMARFGDIVRIEARGFDVRVTLKSGTVIVLNRNAANDLDDGVRVWDARRGMVNLRSWVGGLPPPATVSIRSIDLLPAPGRGGALERLHGTVHTRQGDFTGFVQWDRNKGVGGDELVGRAPEGERRLRFDTIRSIARRSRDSAVVTLRAGGEIVLSGSRDVGQGNRGLYVDDRRYGRVLVSWDAFDRFDLTPGGAGPAYGDFAPGRPLTGTVTDNAGRRLAGRIVYDLDESETTETLDAPSQGVDYTIPFALIAAIVSGGDESADQPVRVTLHSGEKVQLDRSGDLGKANAGLLIFVAGRAEYVPWSDVMRIDFDRR